MSLTDGDGPDSQVLGTLFAHRLLSKPEVITVLERMSSAGASVTDVIMNLGYLDKKRADGIANRLEPKCGFFDVRDFEPQDEAVSSISATFARNNQVLPVRLIRSRLVVAMFNPRDKSVLDRLSQQTGFKVVALASFEEETMAAIERWCSPTPFVVKGHGL